jgi:hypothetical protein
MEKHVLDRKFRAKKSWYPPREQVSCAPLITAPADSHSIQAPCVYVRISIEGLLSWDVYQLII